MTSPWIKNGKIGGTEGVANMLYRGLAEKEDYSVCLDPISIELPAKLSRDDYFSKSSLSDIA